MEHSKRLPENLILGVSKTNKKILISYLSGMAKDNFDNCLPVVYSISKIRDGEYVYELHDGSSDLTYLELVKTLVIFGDKNDITLKTQYKNVKVRRSEDGTLECYTLTDFSGIVEGVKPITGIVDFKTKGRLTRINSYSNALPVSSMLLTIFSFIFFIFNPFIEKEAEVIKIKAMSPSAYILNIDFKDHSETKYIKNIKYSNSAWSYSIGETEPASTENVRNKNKENDAETESEQLSSNVEEVEIEEIAIKNIFEIKSTKDLDGLNISTIPENVILEKQQ